MVDDAVWVRDSCASGVVREMASVLAWEVADSVVRVTSKDECPEVDAA